MLTPGIIKLTLHPIITIHQVTGELRIKKTQQMTASRRFVEVMTEYNRIQVCSRRRRRRHHHQHQHHHHTCLTIITPTTTLISPLSSSPHSSSSSPSWSPSRYLSSLRSNTASSRRERSPGSWRSPARPPRTRSSSRCWRSGPLLLSQG